MSKKILKILDFIQFSDFGYQNLHDIESDIKIDFKVLILKFLIEYIGF